MHDGEVLIPITMFISFAAMTFGIVYMRTRQNLAMIEKGMNPKSKENRPAPFTSLKWGLVGIGCGAGLLLAYFIDEFIIRTNYINRDHNNPAIYFSLIGIGGGIGLVISYMIEKKHWLDKQGNGGKE
jgi:hypothetical protein